MSKEEIQTTHKPGNHLFTHNVPFLTNPKATLFKRQFPLITSLTWILSRAKRLFSKRISLGDYSLSSVT